MKLNPVEIFLKNGLKFNYMSIPIYVLFPQLTYFHLHSPLSIILMNLSKDLSGILYTNP